MAYSARHLRPVALDRRAFIGILSLTIPSTAFFHPIKSPSGVMQVIADAIPQFSAELKLAELKLAERKLAKRKSAKRKSAERKSAFSPFLSNNHNLCDSKMSDN